MSSTQKRKRAPAKKTKKSYVNKKKRLYESYSSTIHKGPEVKAIDMAPNHANFAYTGTINLLNGITQTATEFGRIGNIIRAKSLRMIGSLYFAPPNLAANYQNDFLRTLIIYDKQNNGNQPGFSDIITSNIAGALTSSTALDQPNMAMKSRFLVLMDRKHYIPAFTTTVSAAGGTGNLATPSLQGQQDTGFLFDEYFPLDGLETQYNYLSNSTFTSINAGAFWVVTWSLSGATCPWFYNGSFRFEYTDV